MAMRFQSLQPKRGSIFISSNAGGIWVRPPRLTSFSRVSMICFGLNLFCGGAAQTIEHEKLRLDPWRATMANTIIFEEAKGRGTQDLETRCLSVLRCLAFPRTAAEGCDHIRVAHASFQATIRKLQA